MFSCWICGAKTSAVSYGCRHCQSQELVERCATAGLLLEDTELGLEAAQFFIAKKQLQAIQQLRGELQEGLNHVVSTLRWGFTETIWHLQQLGDVLQSIDHTLKTPSETQANEWRSMAEQLFQRGVLDDAEEFFRRSLDANRLDYRTYTGLALLQIRTNQFDEAYHLLERSKPHAPKAQSPDEPISNYVSYSERLQGRIAFCQGDSPRAEGHLARAVTYSPQYAEAFYDHALYAAQAGKPDESICSLRSAIQITPEFWKLVQVESLILPVKHQAKTLLLEFLQDARQVVTNHVRSEQATLMDLRKSRKREIRKALDIVYQKVSKPTWFDGHIFQWIKVAPFTDLRNDRHAAANEVMDAIADLEAANSAYSEVLKDAVQLVEDCLSTISMCNDYLIIDTYKNPEINHTDQIRTAIDIDLLILDRNLERINKAAIAFTGNSEKWCQMLIFSTLTIFLSLVYLFAYWISSL